ncbi:hypothetical protein Mapa_007750 [Marchantia paleacea]|nr:hypothetical protein Mapa_007750 [Marchantia paleacea]
MEPHADLFKSAPTVVVITSGKGRVGKTTTTANLGMCLARLNFKVVAIDADVGLRNLDLLLGLENRVNYTVMEVLNGECRLDQALIRDKRWTNFELMCINKPRYKMPLGFGGKALTWMRSKRDPRVPLILSSLIPPWESMQGLSLRSLLPTRLS